MKHLFIAAAAVIASGAIYAQSGSSYGYRDEQNIPRGYGRYHGYDQSQSSDRMTQARQSSDQRPVKEMNRASNLIGAEVRLRNNEKAGTVKDVVIDFNSGRVAYIVVNANEVLNGDRTHVAVPARAFRVSGEQRHVTVDADRSRFQQVRSFTQNNLPPIRTQMAQMNRWRGDSSTQSSSDYADRERQRARQQQNRYSSNTQSGQDTDWYLYEWYIIDPIGSSQRDDSSTAEYRQDGGTGAYGQSEYGSTARNRSAERQYNRQYNQDDQYTDGQSRYWRNTDEYSGSGASSQSGSGGTQSSNSSTRQFSGWLRNIDEQNNSLTVESQNRTLTFQLKDNANIRTDEGQSGELQDLEEGEWVDVRYRYRNGSNEAQRITQQ